MSKKGNCNFIYRKPKTQKENKQDFYQTIPQMVFCLMEHISCYKPDISILDPCAGKGGISNILKTKYKNVTTIDLFDKENPIDFLTYYPEERFDFIIMNSPFSTKFKFIDHALEVAHNVFTLWPGLANNYNKTNEYKRKKEYEGQITMYPKVILSEELSEDGSFVQSGTQCYCWHFYTNHPYQYAEYESFEIIRNLHDYDEQVREYLGLPLTE